MLHSKPRLNGHVERARIEVRERAEKTNGSEVDGVSSDLRTSLERLTRPDEEAELRLELAKIQTHRESIVAMMRTLLSIEERVGRVETMMTEVHQIAKNTTPVKEWYSVKEVAEILGKAEFTVREWCRLGRVNAAKRDCGRGLMKEWILSYEELSRIQNQGLLAD